MAIFNKKPLFIAEISSNHNGSLERCKELIDAAYLSGCDGVKFQLFRIRTLFSEEAIINNPKLLERVDWELKTEFIPILSEYSKSKGLLFSVTPFYLEAVEIIAPFVDFFKIASYELLWGELFQLCAETGKPLVFSVGMSNIDEISSALNSIKNSSVKEVLILHCNSAYPTPVKDVNLLAIETLRNKFSRFLPGKVIEFGWSDHTVLESVVISSILKHNSKMVEFHIDLDGNGKEYETGHCWLPNDIARVIKLIRESNEAEGSGVISPSESELFEREWRADPSDGYRPLLSTRSKLL